MKKLIASELRYRRLFEAAQDGILILDAKTGMIEDVNPYLIKMLGYSREEFVKKKLWDVGAFKDIKASKEAFEALQEDQYIRYEDLPLVTKDGRLMQVEFVSSVYLVGDEKVIQCDIRDITEHKQIVTALQENEKKYHDLINQNPDGYFIIELSGNILTINQAMCKELEFSEEELLSMSIWDIIPEQFLDQYRERLTRILKGESLKESAEYEVRGKNGKIHYVEVLSAPRYSGKNIIGFQGIARDISVRRQAEEALRVSEAHFRMAIDNSPLILSNQDQELRYTWLYNPKMGFDPQFVLGKTDAELFAPEDAARLIEIKRRVLETGMIARETISATRNGKTYFHDITVEWLRNVSGNCIGVTCAEVDITERKQAEDALRASEAKFRSYTESAPLGVFVADRLGRYVDVNAAANEMLGYTGSELFHQTISDVLAPQALEEGLQLFQKVVQNGSATAEIPFRRKDGTQFWSTLLAVKLNEDRIMAYCQDITERKQMEESLRLSEEKYRALVAEVNDGFYETDEAGVFTLANPALARIFGVETPQALIGRMFMDFVAPERKSADHGEAYKGAMSTGRTPEVINGQITRPDGTRVFIEIKPVMIVKADRVSGSRGVVRDVTERKRAEQELANLAKFPSENPSPVLRVNRDGIVMYANASSGELLSNWGCAVGGTVPLFWRDLVAQALANRESKTVDLEYDGKILELVISPIAEIEYVNLYGRDITDRKRVEKALEESEYLFRSFLEQSEDAIMLANNQGVLIQWSKGAEKLTGFSREESLGQPIWDIQFRSAPDEFKSTKNIKDIKAALQKILLTGKGTQLNNLVEAEIQRADGTRLSTQTLAFPIHTDKGFLLGSILRNITERKKTEAELLRYRNNLEALVSERTAELVIAKERAEAANQAKSAFLATMSHEIRTPLNGVLGMAHLALQSNLTERQSNYLLNIQSSGESLLSTINNILDFSKIEAGKIALEQVDFSLDSLFQGISSVLAHKAQEKGLELVFNTALNVPRLLVGDPLRLGQVLTNLLGNAIKFTEAGEIVVKVSLIKKTAQKVILEFSIHDTGIGITQAQLAELFKPFSQADTSTSRKYGGTGLGLVISQRLVNLMGGEIKVDSQVGQGTTFIFRISLKQQVRMKNESFAVASELSGLRVLVVDDHAATQEFLQSVLESFTFHVTIVRSAEAALARLEQKQSKQHFDLILMDRSLPGKMDGLEAIRCIKQNPKLSATPALLLIHAEEMIRQTAENAPDGYLVKPITRSQLFDEIMRVFGHKTPPRTSTEKKKFVTGTLNKLHGRQALLVEDNEINQLVATEMLQSLGLQVSLANNGEEAVRMVMDGQFEVVLMDIQMPGMDGYQATAQIRTDPRFTYARLPIIAITAHALADDREKALDAGLNDYVAKPIDMSQLANALLRWLVPQEAMPAQQDKVDISITENVDALPAILFDALDSINMKSALARLGGKQELYLRLVLMFRDNQVQTTQAIHAALQSEDLLLARRLAHTFKGLAATIGADKLSLAAKNLETAIAQGNSALSAGNLELVEQELTMVMAVLARIPQTLPTTGQIPVPESHTNLPTLESQLIQLGHLLHSNDAEATTLIGSILQRTNETGLKKELKALDALIRRFDFEKALQELEILVQEQHILLPKMKAWGNHEKTNHTGCR